jgi:REG-2-like HAD superfamily hydrolase
MLLRAVLLDFGHTLAREEPARHAIYARAARSRGLATSDLEMRARMRRVHDELPRRIDGRERYCDPWFRAFIRRIFVLELGLAPRELDGLVAELFATFEDPRTFRLARGARELLLELRRAGLALALVSNWSERLPRLLRALELDQSFDAVVCSALEGTEKPEPAIYRLALERLGHAPEDALFAGDDLERDVLGPRRAGMRAVLVAHGADSSPAAAPAEAVERVPDLPSLGSYILNRR